MKISDFTNEEALDLLADIIDPITQLLSDKLIASALQKGDSMKAIKLGLKKHQTEIIQVLARLHNQSVNDYKGNLLTMTKDLLELINDEEVRDFFTSQGLTDSTTSSGSATENTEGDEA